MNPMEKPCVECGEMCDLMEDSHITSKGVVPMCRKCFGIYHKGWVDCLKWNGISLP